jgi:hypothetical protein
MDPQIRDGLLAGVSLATLLDTLRRRAAVDTLRDPIPVAGGVATALLVEWAFLRYPKLLSWWERPAVNRGSVLGLVGVAALARRRPRLLAAGVWGLATYLALLGRLLLVRARSDSPSDSRQADG